MMAENASTVDLGRLVLSRKKNERIKIAPNVWITLVEVRGDKCRLMIEAPKTTSVLREEVLPIGEQYNAAVLGIPVPEEQPEEADEPVPERKTA
jgi:carbon storage regulator